jgi:uncharacterized YigZ family protein
MKLLEKPEDLRFEIKRSQFIVHLQEIKDPQEVKDLVKKIKKEHIKASHVVHAFVFGQKNSLIYGCSDDGEPPGTAGRPALEILKGSEVTNTLVTVVRYFGGTKLGTGGLVKAYGDAVKNIIAQATWSDFEIQAQLILECDYFDMGLVKKNIELYEAKIVKDSFLEKINLEISLPHKFYRDFLKNIKNSCSARVTVKEKQIDDL